MLWYLRQVQLHLDLLPQARPGKRINVGIASGENYVTRTRRPSINGAREGHHVPSLFVVFMFWFRKNLLRALEPSYSVECNFS